MSELTTDQLGTTRFGKLFSAHIVGNVPNSKYPLFLSLFQDRNRVRNEFIGLQIVTIFKTFREGRPDPDLEVQLDVFEEQRASDETHVSKAKNEII